MTKNYTQMPRAGIHIDAQAVTGRFEAWRHSIGHGGVDSQPLPEKIIQGMRKLQPRLVRIFLQEYFNVYPAHGVFDWSKLDPYMDSFSQTTSHVYKSARVSIHLHTIHLHTS